MQWPVYVIIFMGTVYTKVDILLLYASVLQPNYGPNTKLACSLYVHFAS